MPKQRDFLEYHTSIARELDATKNRIRHLIGNQHWLSDGEHKEAVLRKVLRNHLPESVRVGTGFVCFRDKNSSQIDIIITSSNKPTLFKDGELVLVTPDAVKAILEVKTSLHSRTELRKTLDKLSSNIEAIRSEGKLDCYAGLFVYEESPEGNRIKDNNILEYLRSEVEDEQRRVINWIAFGPDRFFRYWERGSDVHSRFDDSVWHSYGLNNGLAHAYFISNVIWDISMRLQGTANHDAQYAWFPIEGGKEKFRRWCISRSKGPAIQFNH